MRSVRNEMVKSDLLRKVDTESINKAIRLQGELDGIQSIHREVNKLLGVKEPNTNPNY